MINGIVFRLIAPIKVSGLKESACAWFLIVLLTSFYLPLEIKYGAKQTKWFFASIIILASSGALFALRTASGFSRFADFPTIGTLSPIFIGITLIVLSVISYLISLRLSIKIFIKKDL